MVHLRGYKLNPLLAEYLSEHPHLKNGLSESKITVVHRATKWRLPDRLSGHDIDELVAAFKAGAAKRVLAMRYGINIKSVKKLLRERGVRKKSRWDKAA
jgi:hypothetical protein